jgi:hypothetical protein
MVNEREGVERRDVRRRSAARHRNARASSVSTPLRIGTPPVSPHTLPGKEPQRTPITPEIIEWARQQLNEEETVAGLREIRETGGLELDDFIQELEQEATPRE